MFYRFAPEIGHPICASTSTNHLSSASRSAFAITARSRARRSMRIISSEAGLSGIPMSPMVPDERALARDAYRNFKLLRF